MITIVIQSGDFIQDARTEKLHHIYFDNIKQWTNRYNIHTMFALLYN